jgi:enhancing lycopene biosynthesis protein 2
LIQGFHAARKPIAAICIAPAIVALSIGHAGPRMTLGPASGEAAIEAAKTGAQFVDCKVDAVCTDQEQRIVSTPAYLLGPDLLSVDRGIALCISEAIRLCTE